MQQVVRFDAPGEVLAVQQNADGSVSATADTSRCGIYEYRRADGTIRRELVLPEHLFDPESLRTLGGVAVTAWPPTGHPPELLNPENASRYASGHVHETVDAVEAPHERDFGYVRVRLTGRTADAVKKLTQGKLFTSPGYLLPNYDATPGVHPVWGPYDAIQGPRVYNHLALTDTPRGGSSMVVHLDSLGEGADVAVGVDVPESLRMHIGLLQEELENTMGHPLPPAGVQAVVRHLQMVQGGGPEVRTDPASWVKDETKWNKAKALAEKEGHAGDYDYVTGIYKKMGGKIASDAREDSMIVLRLDGTQREVSVDPLVAEILRQEFNRRDADMAEAMAEKKSLADQYADAKSQYDALKAKMDEMSAMMEKMKGEKEAGEASMDALKSRADAAEKALKDPTELRKILAPRVSLEATAREVLPKDQHERIDSMTDDELRRATVQVLLPSLRTDGVTGDRLTGQFEVALASRHPQTRTDGKPPVKDPRAPDPRAHGGRTSAELHQARTDAEYVPPKRPGAN